MKYWFSFADSALPKGQQFLGACMLEVQTLPDDKDTVRAAVNKSHSLGINPGGEIQVVELPVDAAVHESWFNILLDKATIKAHDTKEGWSNPRPLS